jgi:hypothetical protein
MGFFVLDDFLVRGFQLPGEFQVFFGVQVPAESLETHFLLELPEVILHFLAAISDLGGVRWLRK